MLVHHFGIASTLRSIDLQYCINDYIRIVSGSEDKTVRVWDASTGESLQVPEGHPGGVNSVAFNRDGTRIVSGSVDEVRVWDASTGESLQVLEGL